MIDYTVSKPVRQVRIQKGNSISSLISEEVHDWFIRFAESDPFHNEEDCAKHDRGYTSLLTEVGSMFADKKSAIAFAKHFVDKSALHSNTKAGRSALRMETWIYKHGGLFAKRFVETVVDSDTGTYIAVFDGKIPDNDFKRFEEQTSEFAKCKVLVKAGFIDPDTKSVSDITIIECTPRNVKKKSKAMDMNHQPPSREIPTGFDEYPSNSSDEYAESVVVEPSPVVEKAPPDKAIERFINRVKAGKSKVAKDFRDRYGDDWKKVLYGTAWNLHNRKNESFDYDSDSGAMRSLMGSWAVFESSVLVEGESQALTVITLHDASFGVHAPLEEVTDTILCTLAYYDDLLEEGDFMVEGILREMGEDGIVITNRDTVFTTLSESTIDSRNLVIERNRNLRRIAEQGDEETDHMEEPLYYRDDLQDYYEAQMVAGIDSEEAISNLKAKFKLKKEVIVTPTGEVRVKGVKDRPKPLPPEELPPEEEEPADGEEEVPAEESIDEQHPYFRTRWNKEGYEGIKTPDGSKESPWPSRSILKVARKKGFDLGDGWYISGGSIDTPELTLWAEPESKSESLDEMAELSQRKGHIGFKGKVFVYYNINLSKKLGEKLWSVRDAKSGLVIGHDTAIAMRDVVFVVGKKGMERVRATGVKNVHAGVRGHLDNAKPSTSGTEITYNPRKQTTFVTKDGGEPVRSAKSVSLIDKRVWATGLELGEAYVETISYPLNEIGPIRPARIGKSGGTRMGSRGSSFGSVGGAIPQPFRDGFTNPTPEELQRNVDIQQGKPNASQVRKAKKELDSLTKNQSPSKAQNGRIETLLSRIAALESGETPTLETDADFEDFMSTTFPDVWDAAQTHETVEEAQKATLTHEEESVYRKWRRLHNMTTEALRGFLRSGELSEVLKSSRNNKTKGIREGIREARRLLVMKHRSADNWTESDWNTARRQIRFIEALRQNPAPTLDELERPTRKLYTLKAWGHDPSLRECVLESDIFDARDNTRELNRWVDATPGESPYPLVVGPDALPPTFHKLRERKKSLSDTDEVHKATILGETWYFANNSSLYVARPSLQETIDAVEAFLK